VSSLSLQVSLSLSLAPASALAGADSCGRRVIDIDHRKDICR
jgi:hypothetical protein